MSTSSTMHSAGKILFDWTYHRAETTEDNATLDGNPKAIL